MLMSLLESMFHRVENEFVLLQMNSQSLVLSGSPGNLCGLTKLIRNILVLFGS